MAIETDNFAPTPDAEQRRDNQRDHTNFGGADLGTDPAVTGARDFVALTGRIGLTRIDASVEPYLEEVLKLVKDNLPNVSRHRLDRVSNAYVFRFDGPDATANFFGIQFAQTSDPVHQKFIPVSRKLEFMREDIKTRFPNDRTRLVDARVIRAGVEADMSRAYEMADCIVRTFQVTTVNELKNANIEFLQSNEFVADWRISEVRAAESQMSPQGVRPRMDVGLVLKAKITNQFATGAARDIDVDYRTLGVIGGYTEIREREEVVVNGQRVLMYRPVFNVTVYNAAVPLEGIFGILLAAFAPTIYDTMFWVKQWYDLGKNRPNPGLLEVDPNNRSQGLELKDQDELLDFVRTYFAQPILAVQFQDGADAIPNVWRLADPSPKSRVKFINRLTHFFNAPDEPNAGGMELSVIADTRYEGVVGDPKGQTSDSRDIDYLSIAATNGFGTIDPNMRRILMASNNNAEERARLISNVVGNFMPLHLTTQAFINPEFIKWLITKTEANRIAIVDPNSSGESRSLSSYTANFAPAHNLGSIVGSGAVNRGLGLASVWTNY